jgi:hypothetical protein
MPHDDEDEDDDNDMSTKQIDGYSPISDLSANLA